MLKTYRRSNLIPVSVWIGFSLKTIEDFELVFVRFLVKTIRVITKCAYYFIELRCIFIYFFNFMVEITRGLQDLNYQLRQIVR